MEGKLTILPTLDGSLTFYNQTIHQSYHSVNGALQEARHVFLENGLFQFLQAFPREEISILEVGFGAGLNFMVTADYCESQNITLNYTGLEPYPVDRSLIIESHYNKWINHQKLWNNFISCYKDTLRLVEMRLSSLIKLRFEKILLEAFKSEKKYDLIYYDAFAPATQPELWDRDSILHALSMLADNGMFISYSITGNLKRILRSEGFTVEKPKGAAGKREMVRAYKSSLVTA